MKTRMQRWLARVALSLVGIAAWGTGAAAQSLSGVYGGENCPYRLTFRGADVVYVQFLAGGKVMQELPGQYKVDGDRVAMTAPSWGAVFTQRANALETPAMGKTMVCTKLSDVALAQIACDQFGSTYNTGNMCFDTRPIPVTPTHDGDRFGDTSEAKGGSGWRPDQSQGAVELPWGTPNTARGTPNTARRVRRTTKASVTPSPVLLLLKVSRSGRTIEATVMFPSDVDEFTDAAVHMAKSLKWRSALKHGEAVEAFVVWEFRVATAIGFITVNVTQGGTVPFANVYIDQVYIGAPPVLNYMVMAGLHTILANWVGGGKSDTVQVDSGATVVKSYVATAR